MSTDSPSRRPSRERIAAGAQALAEHAHQEISIGSRGFDWWYRLRENVPGGGVRPSWYASNVSEICAVAASVGELEAALRWALTTISDCVVGHWDDAMSAEFEKAQRTLGDAS